MHLAPFLVEVALTLPDVVVRRSLRQLVMLVFSLRPHDRGEEQKLAHKYRSGGIARGGIT